MCHPERRSARFWRTGAEGPLQLTKTSHSQRRKGAVSSSPPPRSGSTCLRTHTGRCHPERRRAALARRSRRTATAMSSWHSKARRASFVLAVGVSPRSQVPTAIEPRSGDRLLMLSIFNSKHLQRCHPERRSARRWRAGAEGPYSYPKLLALESPKGVICVSRGRKPAVAGADGDRAAERRQAFDAEQKSVTPKNVSS